MNKLVLQALGINKFFHVPKRFHVLKEINFSINRGEFLTMMGKSGCGKSTLMYILSTLDSDYEGTLEINGQSLHGKDQNHLAKFRNKHIGFVFQFHYLLPEFTALKNIMIPGLKLGIHSSEEIEHQAYEKLKLLDIEDHALKISSRLSGGQQQRVAIARALINEPTIIMCDEPTGNLDSDNARNVLDIFKELTCSQDQTILAVTHDKDFALNSDRIIEMSDGRIVSKESHGTIVS